jgi:hypothetical protein
MKTTLFGLFFLALFGQTNAQVTALRLNEIVSTNSFLLSDLNNAGDWIEIYNPTANDINLGGFYMTDDPADLTKYQIPSGNPDFTIAPGGFVLVWADDSASGLHANFKLSSAGEFFALVEANGSSIVDSVTFPALSADYSWGRAVDATGNWVQFSPTTTTPASSNQSTSVGVVEDVFSNIKVLNGGANHCLLEYTCSSSGRVVLAWYNALGQTISLQETTVGIGTNRTVAPSDISRGINYFSLSMNGKIITRKIFIE